MPGNKKDSQIKTLWVIVIVLFVIIIISFALSLQRLSNINSQSDYKIFVQSGVIDVLNREYVQEFEKFYCIDGTVDDINKEFVITSIFRVECKVEEFGRCITSDRYACSDNLGIIHTHPKKYGILPQCGFSGVDFYTLGESFGHDMRRIGGVYCSTDKISFYLSNTEEDETIFGNNRRISYIEIKE